MNETKYFTIEKDPASENKFMVVLRIIIYKEKFSIYPPFLKEFENEKGKREGYATKFWFIVPKEDNEHAYLMEKDDAKILANNYECLYNHIIEKCENTGNWDHFPFNDKKMILIYSK